MTRQFPAPPRSPDKAPTGPSHGAGGNNQVKTVGYDAATNACEADARLAICTTRTCHRTARGLLASESGRVLWNARKTAAV